jgi:hypothetical protein
VYKFGIIRTDALFDVQVILASEYDINVHILVQSTIIELSYFTTKNAKI